MEDDDPRVCERCRVVVTSGPTGWAHPVSLQEKFSLSVCGDPEPGRPAKPSEIRFGRGAKYRSDRFSITGAIPELAQEPSTPLDIGVDGSYKLTLDGGSVRKPMSWGYLTTAGTYGLGTSLVPGNITGYERATQAELRAIWWALVRTARSHPVRVFTDSLDAVELASDWRAGRYRMPAGYSVERASGREATLMQLARLIHVDADRITIVKVQAHSGHPLNEGADALAKMARAFAVGRLEQNVVASDARRAVLSSLERYALIL